MRFEMVKMVTEWWILDDLVYFSDVIVRSEYFHGNYSESTEF